MAVTTTVLAYFVDLLPHVADSVAPIAPRGPTISTNNTEVAQNN
jgi:hypothetical protein